MQNLRSLDDMLKQPVASAFKKGITRAPQMARVREDPAFHELESQLSRCRILEDWFKWAVSTGYIVLTPELKDQIHATRPDRIPNSGREFKEAGGIERLQSAVAVLAKHADHLTSCARRLFSKQRLPVVWRTKFDSVLEQLTGGTLMDRRAPFSAGTDPAPVFENGYNRARGLNNIEI